MEATQIETRVPGFTADASLSSTIGGWYGVAALSFSTRGAEVVPQQRRSLGCFIHTARGGSAAIAPQTKAALVVRGAKRCFEANLRTAAQRSEAILGRECESVP